MSQAIPTPALPENATSVETLATTTGGVAYVFKDAAGNTVARMGTIPADAKAKQ